MATEQQIPKIVGTLVEHQSAFMELSNEDSQWVIANAKPAISLFSQAVKTRQRNEEAKLLRFLMTVNIDGGSSFIAKRNFVDLQDDLNAAVKIVSMNSMFREYFLSQIEENYQINREPATLKVHEMVNNDLHSDVSVIQELGRGFYITLYHLWNLLLLQSDGKKTGALCTQHYNSNYCFVYSQKYLKLCLISVSMEYQKGWRVNAQEIGCEGPSAKNRIISREGKF